MTFNPWELRQILNEITLLQAEDPGFDWATDCAYVGGVPTTTFTMSYPRRGLTADDTGLMFESPGNILSYVWPEDGASSAERLLGRRGRVGATTLTSTPPRAAVHHGRVPVPRTGRLVQGDHHPGRTGRQDGAGSRHLPERPHGPAGTRSGTGPG